MSLERCSASYLMTNSDLTAHRSIVRRHLTLGRAADFGAHPYILNTCLRTTTTSTHVGLQQLRSWQARKPANSKPWLRTAILMPAHDLWFLIVGSRSYWPSDTDNPISPTTSGSDWENKASEPQSRGLISPKVSRSPRMQRGGSDRPSRWALAVRRAELQCLFRSRLNLLPAQHQRLYRASHSRRSWTLRHQLGSAP